MINEIDLVRKARRLFRYSLEFEGSVGNYPGSKDMGEALDSMDKFIKKKHLTDYVFIHRIKDNLLIAIVVLYNTNSTSSGFECGSILTEYL